jgi:predicted transcriptional regulator
VAAIGMRQEVYGRDEMAERPALSKGEMDVARVLWEIGPATVRAVHEALVPQREIDFATVQTYLRRLESKGYASSQLDGRVRVYAVRTKPRTVIRETVNDLVERLFGGQTMPLVRHLIEERGIDASDIVELRALVERLEQEARDDDA